MTTVELLAELRERDIRVWIEGETLRCRAPKGALTPELREQEARLRAQAGKK